MKTKETVRPAADYGAILIVAQTLDIDPEIADEYFYAFAKEHGKPGIDSMLKAFEFLINNDLYDTLKDVVEHDLFLKKETGMPLMCEQWGGERNV